MAFVVAAIVAITTCLALAVGAVLVVVLRFALPRHGNSRHDSGTTRSLDSKRPGYLDLYVGQSGQHP